jgi:head-tail adaptor
LNLDAARDRVTLERKTTIQTPFGHEQTWSNVCEVWGRLHPWRARELVQAGSRRGEVSHRVTLRGDFPVQYAEDRVRVCSQIFEILEPPTHPAPNETILYVKELPI